MCEHIWGKIHEKKLFKNGTPFFVHECIKCKAGKFEDTGNILTPKGMVKFLTTYQCLEDKDFEKLRGKLDASKIKEATDVYGG